MHKQWGWLISYMICLFVYVKDEFILKFLKIPIFCTANYEMKILDLITNFHEEPCHYVECNNL